MLNVQTEHLENHTARLTVELEPERLEKAMRQTARRLAKKARIPGFRPGKAPYNVVVNMFGREYVLGQALDEMGNEVYREALDASEVQPYAPGSLEDVEEDGLRLIFVIPMVPAIDLGDYREIRIDHEMPEVTDDMVNDAMEQLRENQAVIEPVERAAQMGDQVTLSHLEVVLLPEEDAAEEAEDTAETDPAVDSAVEADDTEVEAEVEVDEDGDEDEEEVLIHQHNYDSVLREDERDLFPGFSVELVGLAADDEKVFTVLMPEDDEEERIAGRTLRCEVHVEALQSRTVPEWSDTLAQTVSENEFETMLELRMDVRRRLEEQAQNMADQELFQDALDQLVEGATLNYPEEVVQDHLNDILAEIDRNMRQQNLSLEDFMRITGQTEETLREQYRDDAAQRAERALVMAELVTVEELSVDTEDIEAEIEKIVKDMDEEQALQFRQFLTSDFSLNNIQNQLLSSRASERLIAIVKGEDPPIGVTPAPETEEDAEAETETESEAETATDETPVDDGADTVEAPDVESEEEVVGDENEETE